MTRVTIGSPPRMRGKEMKGSGPVYEEGITPAYAGKSCWCGEQSYDWWDHPRVCGEKYSFVASPNASGGSPPRMRGKVLPTEAQFVEKRITPAYAGKR